MRCGSSSAPGKSGAAAWCVTTQVELNLSRKGIKPGADGFELLGHMERVASALGAAEGKPHSAVRKLA